MAIAIHHLNLGEMKIMPGDPNPRTIMHCVLLEENGRYALIDTGLGADEMARPDETFGPELMAGWQFKVTPTVTALYQLKERGIDPAAVTNIVMTHLDVDHAGGLVDFPNAAVHLSAQEKANLDAGNPRYLFNQFAHGPKWKTYAENDSEWAGLPARRLDLPFSEPVYLVPLYGHTLGHCGVAIPKGEGKWLLHAGDVYYRRVEATIVPNPMEATVSHTCDNDTLRRESLALVKKLMMEQGNDIDIISTHDFLEFGGDAGKRILFVVTSHDRFDGPNAHATGIWLEEFAAPFLALRKAGVDVTVASPKGGIVPIDPRSAPTPEQERDWDAAIWATKFSVPLNLVPTADDFDAIFLPGGHGPVFDLPGNPDLGRLLTQFDTQGKIIGAVCHGPAGFLGAKGKDGNPLVAGKRLTSYTWEEEILSKLDKEVPFILEQRLRDEGAEFIAGAARADHTERDGNLITGQNPWSSESVAHAVTQALVEK